MRRPQRGDHASGGWPRWWKAAIIAFSTLVLCSCRAGMPAHEDVEPGYLEPGMPPSAWTGEHDEGLIGEHMPAGFGPPPLPYQPGGDWSPAGLARPWPADEYLSDGGDRGVNVRVGPEWQVQGLDIEDAVAHYDTLDGQTLVEPSNRVHVYAPRFAAVRAVSRLAQDEQLTKAGTVHQPRPLVVHQDAQLATTHLQQHQPLGSVGDRLAIVARGRQYDGVVSTNLLPDGFHGASLSYEASSAVRTGIYEHGESAVLREATEAAVAWSHDKAVQVVIDRTPAVAVTSDQRGEALFTTEDRRDPAKLRVIKVASAQTAQPGDIIHFTIRYDNIGGQPMGNVTLVDNLTTRLEYEPGSAQSSREANFSTQTNEADSLVLRWEITDPLPPGDGGVVRFRCRVR